MTGVFPTNLTNNMKKDMDAGLSSIVRSQNMYFDSRTGLVKASKGRTSLNGKSTENYAMHAVYPLIGRADHNLSY